MKRGVQKVWELIPLITTVCFFPVIIEHSALSQILTKQNRSSLSSPLSRLRSQVFCCAVSFWKVYSCYLHAVSSFWHACRSIRSNTAKQHINFFSDEYRMEVMVYIIHILFCKSRWRIRCKKTAKQKPRKWVKYSSHENKTETPQETTQLILCMGICLIVSKCVRLSQCDVVKQWEEGRIWCSGLYMTSCDVGEPHSYLLPIYCDEIPQCFLPWFSV